MRIYHRILDRGNGEPGKKEKARGGKKENDGIYEGSLKTRRNRRRREQRHLRPHAESGQSLIFFMIGVPAVGTNCELGIIEKITVQCTQCALSQGAGNNVFPLTT